MRSILSIWLLAAISFSARAQSPGCLKVSCIADSLRTGAHAVMRLDEANIVYQSAGHYREVVHQIVTVLDDSGARHFDPAFPNNSYKKVLSAVVRILDAEGIEVKRYGLKDFASNNYDDGFSLVTDANYISLEPVHPAWPCTMDIRVETDVSGSISPPSWSIVTKGNSVEFSRYSISMPAGLDLLYKKDHVAGEPVVTQDKTIRTHSWEMKNLSGLGMVDPGTGKRKFPMLRLAVSPFQYGGYTGEIRDWVTFGKWFWRLYQEPAEPFPASRQEEIRTMIRQAGSARQVIDTLYRYMQHNMRYVSIWLGIGGLKPFPVSFVDQKKYGDCKALTNYMRYLLLEAGIKSYPVLVYAGENAAPIDTSFASSQFNHVILCVPFSGGDTTWLECTSKYTEPGVLGSFTENRYALLLREDGGHIVSTPRSITTGNLLSTHMTVELDADGSGKGELVMVCKGDLLHTFLEYRATTTREEWKRYLLHESGLKEPDASVITDPRPLDGAQPLIRVAYEKLPVVNSGGKMFIPFRMITLAPGIEWPVGNAFPSKPFIRRDISEYILPEGFRPQSIPEPVSISGSFGSLKTNYQFDAPSRRLTLTAELSLTHSGSGTPAGGDWTRFQKAIREEPGKLLVIVHE